MAYSSCAIAYLLEKIRFDLQSTGFTKEKKFASSLRSLESSLMRIINVIHDAEKKQLHNRSVNNWLCNLEGTVYDAEDFIDGILFEAARSKVEAKPLNRMWAVKCLSASIKRDSKGIVIKEIVKATNAIAEEIGEFGFRNLGADYDIPLSDSLPATSLPDEAAIYGREEDRIKILRLLLQGDKNLDAIALVGGVGLGKTTLAQLVYFDEKVREHFELKAWVDVRPHFDIHRISRTIIEAATFCSIEDYMTTESLLKKLRASLDGKKFLLVLDGFWDDDISNWDVLQICLKSGARGSKIIVTARSQRVAADMGCSTYHLDPLTEDTCWSMLAKSACAGRDTSEIITLEDIGKKILKICRGIPLYVRIIGGLLRFQKTPEKWHHVLEDLQEANSHDSILQSSYYRLPAQLKRCFAYCSLFPRDYEFDKEKLVLLWMAEGFLQESSGQSMEKVGAECVDGLLKRSFFVPVDNSHFKLHHYMHDLAKAVSGGVCLRWESSYTIDPFVKRQTRHLSCLKANLIC